MPSAEAEAACHEALRRIRAAKETGQHWLDLGDIQNLEQIPEEIGELTELRELGLGMQGYDLTKKEWVRVGERCFSRSLNNLGPLSGLSALQMLDVSVMPVSDLGPLSGLSALQTLDVAGTSVSDLGPLSGLGALQTLDVAGTPVSDLGPLSGLSALQTLDVNSTSVSDLGPLSGLSGLRTLHVAGTSVSDLGPLSGLSALQTLDVAGTSVSDLGPLSDLSALQTLDVRFCRSVSDLGPLSGLSALQTLDVSITSVSDLGPLSGLSALQTLDVSITPVSDLGPLSGLSALQTLDVNSTSVSDLGPLSGLSGLQTLHVAGTSVSDLGPLRGLSALQTLHVNSTSVSDLGPLSGLSALQTLYAGSTSVSDLGPLSGLSGLQRLGVSYTSVNDLGPLSGLGALQTLYGSYCTSVSDLGPLRGLSALQTLHVSRTSVSDLGPLSGLSALQTLDVRSTSVSDLGPLSGLSALQTLDVRSTSVSDLGPLSGLSGLQTLDVSFCRSVSDLGPLKGHPALRVLRLFGLGALRLSPELITTLPVLGELYVERMEGVPPEVLSKDECSNCMDAFRSWWEDLRVKETQDQEIKIFVLGNGAAGKTQICRQLRGEGYDDAVPSTHGVQIDILDLLPDKGRGAIRAKLWDFGGQDIYHGTHALFLEGRAVFILVWTPSLDGKGDYEENGLSMHHHGLVYWLDYVRSLAGEDAALVVVQSKCDLESDRASAPLPAEPGFKRPLQQVTCSAKRGEMEELTAALRSATCHLLETHGSYRLPTSWVTVRNRLRELKATEKTISGERFNELCRASHGASNPKAVLNYLHRCGEVFYRQGLFRDEIVLDQEWAVRAIYTVLDRKGPCQTLHQLGGVFTLPQLESFAWRGLFTEEEQQTILGMMESCSICFRLDSQHHHTPQEHLRRYALPDFLPQEKDVTTRVEAPWRLDLPAQKITLEYAFLHQGILRQLLCQIGKLGGADAAYWRYGCCFYDAATHSRARIRAENTATQEAPAKGRIIIETCDGQAAELLARLQKAVLGIRIGQPPQVVVASSPAEPAT